MAASMDDLLVGLDIGSSKVALVAVAREPDGTLTYVNGAYRQSVGIRRGNVVDIASAAESIRGAVVDLEQRVGRRISRVVVNVSGTHVRGQVGRGSVTPMGHEIGMADLERAIADAQESFAPGEQHDILHSLEHAWSVDGQDGIIDPRGMSGYRLDVDMHFTTAISTMINNLNRGVSHAGLHLEMPVATSLAVGEAVFPLESDADCLVIADIGAAVTDVVVYVGGRVWANAVLPLGGGDVTREIMDQFKLNQAAAEDVKQRYGHCDPAQVDEYELVEMPASTGFDALLPRADLARVVRQGASGLALALGHQIEDVRAAGFEPRQMIITGGGSELAGLDHLLMGATDVPVSRGVTRGIRYLPPGLQRPVFATAAGLVIWYARNGGSESAASASLNKLGRFPVFLTGMRKILRVVLP